MEPYVSRLLAGGDVLPRGSHILVALSGGRDSVSLLHKLLSLREAWAWTVTAAHLDHGIRERSARDAAFVRELCAKWQVPLVLERVDVPALREADKYSLEDAARRARYDFLERTARAVGASRVALAHHALDQTETILMHLARGSGLSGVRGMQPLRGIYARPILYVPDREVQAYFERHQLPCVVDETNFDLSNPRNALRHRAIPEMEAIYPALQESFTRASLSFSEDEAALSALSGDLLQELRSEAGGITARIADSPHAALRHRAVMQLANASGLTSDLTRDAILQLDALAASPRGRCDLPHGFCAISDQGRLWIGQLQHCEDALPLGVCTSFGEYTILRETLPWAPENYRSPASGSQYFSALPEGAVLRSRRPGDRMRGNRGTKKLSDYMNEKKIPLWLRDALPLVAVGDRILWLPETGWADPHYFVQNPAQPVIKLMISGKEVLG